MKTDENEDGEKPSGVQGMIRYNTDLKQFEGFSIDSGNSGTWKGLGGVIDVDQDTKIVAEETTDEDKLRFYTNGTQHMIIDDNGNVGIGVVPSATSTTKLEVDGPVKATSFNATSDLRLKENIKPLENSLNKICSLEGIEFNFKNNKNKMIGFIAQDVEKIVPEVITTANDENEYKSLAYGNVTALLVEAVKELREEVKTLRQEIKDLKSV